MDNLRMDRRPNVLPSPRELLSGANPEYPPTHPQSPNYGNASPMDYTNNGGNPPPSQYSYPPHLSFGALHPNGSLPSGLNSGSSDSEKSAASTPIHDIDPKSPFAPNGGVHSPIPHNPPHHQYSYPGAPRHPHDDSLQSSMSNMSMSVGPVPSPPIPTGITNGNDPFQQRPLPPLEPNHHLYPYSAARRGSITDPALHLSGGNDFGRRFSQPDINLPMPTSSASPLSERRGSIATDYSSQPPSPSLHSRPGPLDNRPDLAHMGRRESLPSIALPPGSGVPMFDSFQRRHSIAVTEMPFQSSASNSPTSPFSRRKVDFHFPAIHENERRNSYSAPSSPPVPSSSTSSSSNSTNNVLPKLAIEDVDHSQQPPKHLAMISEQHAPNGSSQSPSNHHHISPRLGSRRASMLAADSAVPTITRRASMPAVPLSRHHGAPDGYHDHDPTSPGGTMPMELDKYRSPSYLAPHHGPHPYSYPQDGLAGSQGGPGGAIAPSPGSPSGSKQETPYSRSPELRVSHKLAERKRRKEMKELFDELRDSLPVEKSMKTSKWEILTKAVDYIGGLKQREVDMEKEIDALRREVASLKQGRS